MNLTTWAKEQLLQNPSKVQKKAEARNTKTTESCHAEYKKTNQKRNVKDIFKFNLIIELLKKNKPKADKNLC